MKLHFLGKDQEKSLKKKLKLKHTRFTSSSRFMELSLDSLVNELPPDEMFMNVIVMLLIGMTIVKYPKIYQIVVIM